MRKLNEADIEKIKNLHAEGMYGTEIARQMGVSSCTISDRLKSLNLKNNPKKPVFTKEEEDCIFARYIKGETIRQIAKDFPQSDDQINYILRKAGLTRRNGVQVHFDENYFNIIEDENRAYFLGLLFADGNIKHFDGTRGKDRHKGWKTQISLNEKEGGDLIRELKRQMGDDRPLRVYDSLGTSGKYIRCSAVVSFGSERLYNDLVKWGMTENKLEQPRLMPPLRPDLIHHFLRGCFDGDGSIFYSNGKRPQMGANICGSKPFLEQANVIFNEVVKTPHTKGRRVFDRGKFGSIHFGTAATCKKLFEYLYQDAHIYMKIKYDKFVNYLKQEGVMP